MNKHDRKTASLKGQIADLEGLGIGTMLLGTGAAIGGGVAAEKLTPAVSIGTGAAMAVAGATKLLPKGTRRYFRETGKAIYFAGVGVKAAKVSATIDLSAAKAKVQAAVERITDGIKNSVESVKNGAHQNGAGKHVEAAPVSS